MSVRSQASTRPSLAVRRAEPSEWRELACALADAFEPDPVFCWLLPGEQTRRRRLKRFFAIETRHVALGHGASVASGERSGAALMLPPGRWRMPLGVQLSQGPQYIRAFGARLPRATGLLAQLERLHLREPHYYIAAIGVIQAAQGQGLGAALLAPVLQRCDQEGLPAYLEASSPRSARLYERLGFSTTRVVRPFGSPPIQLMIRQPSRG